MASHEELWEQEVEQAFKRIWALETTMDAAAVMPPTGPPELDVTNEIIRTLARSYCLLQYQKARISLMGPELGRNYTMVNQWRRNAAAMIESLGITSIGLSKTLTQCGFGRLTDASQGP